MSQRDITRMGGPRFCMVRKFFPVSPCALNSYWPVPVSATVLWPPCTLSVMVTVPASAPFTVGAKVTEIVQPIVDDRIAGQLLTSVNSPEFFPTMAMLLMFKGVSPVLVKCTGTVVLLCTGCVPKGRLAGLNCATGSITFPVRLTCCGLPTALSVMFSVAVSVPTASARNVTAIVQLLPVVNGVSQLLVGL